MKPSEFQTQNQFQGSALIELGAAQQVLHLPSFLRVADTLSWYVALRLSPPPPPEDERTDNNYIARQPPPHRSSSGAIFI